MSSRPLPQNNLVSASRGISNRNASRIPIVDSESPPKEAQQTTTAKLRARPSVEDLIKNSIRVRSQLKQDL